MKAYILLFLSILLWSHSQAQITFEEHLLAATQEWVHDVYASDIDGDGDLDLLGNENYGHIVWFENTNGLGGFGEANIIDDQGDRGDTFSADLDGDGDQDVLVAGQRISWYENTDGAGTFSAPITIDENIFAYGVTGYAADLDNDGDMDVIAGYYEFIWNSGKLAWYQNDGSGNFSNAITISSNTRVRDVLAVDIDNDSDKDVFMVSYYDPELPVPPEHTLKWCENIDGLGTFNSGTIISTGTGYIGDLKTTDVDGDGDPDLLAIKEDYSSNSNLIIWFENIDGQGTFSPAHVISEDPNFARIQADDIDSDGDTDVIASWYDSMESGIIWYENTDGLGNFGPLQTIIFTSNNTGYRPIYTGDFDGDTDIDVIGGSSDKFSWFENNLILGNTEFESSQFSIFPNPATDQFTIQLDAASELERINLYNNLGQLVHSTSVPVVDSSNLSSGMYYVEVITNEGKATKKLIIK